MISPKLLVFASMFACVSICVAHRYISWSTEGALCVCESDEVVAALPDAAKSRQDTVFAWLEKQGVSVTPYYVSSRFSHWIDPNPRVFDTWARGAYNHANGSCFGWRLEWPKLFIAAADLPRLTCLGFVLESKYSYLYGLNEIINVEKLTADELRVKLKRLPPETIDEIVREFEGHLESQ